MFSRLRQWSHHALACLPAAIPTSCALCGKTGGEAICTGCRKQFFHWRHRCRQCAMPLPQTDAHPMPVCGDCMREPPAFDATIAAADYAPPVDQLVLSLKFGNRLALAPLFAHMLRDASRDMEAGLPQQLTAVPLGPRRLAERGFNQALEIAKPLSRLLDIPLRPELAVRTRDTKAQTLLHPSERHGNMRHAFIIPAEKVEQVRGRHIGIVDDVITTGETLNELAATLKRFGAARVTNFVFARTSQRVLPK